MGKKARKKSHSTSTSRSAREVGPFLEPGPRQYDPTCLYATVALRRTGRTAFFAAIICSLLAYVIWPHSIHHIPGLIDLIPGFFCENASTEILRTFIEIGLKSILMREMGVIPPVSAFERETVWLLIMLVLMVGGLVGSIVILVYNGYSFLGYANVFQCVAFVASLVIALLDLGCI